MRADMEALMARLILAEQALLDARLQISAARKAAPLGANVHRRAQSLAKQWSFEVATYTRSANPKSIEALRWAAMEENPIRDASVTAQYFKAHNPQLYLARAQLCKGSDLVTVEKRGSPRRF